MSLNNVTFGVNQFCGPSVLSVMTGKSTDYCAAVIQGISGEKTIKAVEFNHIVEAFNKLGFDCNPVRVLGQTLYGTLSSLANGLPGNGKYIIGVPRHVVAVEIVEGEILLCDNHTKHPINAAGSARLMQRVDVVYKLSERPKPKREDVIAARLKALTSEIADAERKITYYTSIKMKLASEKAGLRDEEERIRESESRQDGEGTREESKQ